MINKKPVEVDIVNGVVSYTFISDGSPDVLIYGLEGEGESIVSEIQIEEGASRTKFEKTYVGGIADFSLDDPNGRKYIGQYSDDNPVPSTNPDKYTWRVFQGEQGVSVTSTITFFYLSKSQVSLEDGEWVEGTPTWEDGRYTWVKIVTIYSNGTSEESKPVNLTGATGRSVDKIEEWYYLSNKSDALEGGTWSKTPPTWTNGKYIWTKNKIIYKNPSGTEETAPINNTGGFGQKGDTGTDAKTVRLNNIIHAVHFDQDGLMPSVSSIVFPASVQGFVGVTPYYEFKMGSTVVRGSSTSSSWTMNTSTMKYSDFPLTVTVNVSVGGQTLATDIATIVGTKPGQDAYTVVLANESHTFVGDVSNAIAGDTTANIIAYRGGTQIGATIGAISGLPTGMTSTIYSNDTTAARVTFRVTTSMTSPNGVVNIPVTVNGKSFTKVFNYAIAFKGAKGDKGTDGIAGKDGVGIRTTVLAYASSTSGTTTPSSGWQTTVPTVAAGNYLWTRTTWTYTDNSTENGYTVSRIGKDGNTGKDGIAGKDGVGIKSTSIHYAKSTSGTSHSGVTWLTTVPSVPNGQYLWTRTTWTYDDNTTETGYSVAKMGETGATGPQGVSITKVDVQYYLSTSATSLTGGSWSTTAPAWIDGRYMWSKTVTTYTSGTPSESKPVCITGAKGTTGGAGRGISSIVEEFYLSTSKTTQTGGSWVATPPTWSTGKYIWTRSLITYTTGTPATSTTKPLVSSEWEAVNEIQIGGRNLLKNSGEKVSNGNYNIARYDLTDAIKENEEVTLTIWGSLAATKSYFSAYNSGGSINVATLTNNGNGTYSSTFKWKIGTSTNTYLNVYAFTNAQTGTSTINKIKLEKGNKATDWSPSPEEVKSDIDSKADSKETAEQIEQARKDLIASQEKEVAELKAQIKKLDAQRASLEKARQNDMTAVANQFVSALGRVSAVETSLGDQSADWNFINTNIKMSNEGLMIGDAQKGNYLLQQSNRLDFISNGTVVAYVSNNELWIESGVFTNKLTIGGIAIRKNGADRIRFE